MATATPGYKADIRTTGDPIAFSDEPMIDTGDGTTFEMSNDALNVLYWGTELTVEVDSGAGYQPVEPKEVFHLFGKVEFATDQTGNDVRITGEYVPKIVFALGTDVEYTRNNESLEVAVFSDEDQRRIYGLSDFEASIDGFQLLNEPIDAGEDSLSEQIDGRKPVVLCYRPSSDDAYEVRAVCHFTEQTLSSSVDDVVQSTVSVSGSAPKGQTLGNQVIFERHTT